MKVAEEFHAFASLGGPSQAPAYADELASRHILCINCGLGVPDSVYQKNAPYMWGPFQTPEQFLLNLGDYVVNRLLHRKAAHAGDPTFRSRNRTFGVVHFEQDPPVFSDVEKLVRIQGKKRGFVPKVHNLRRVTRHGSETENDSITDLTVRSTADLVMDSAAFTTEIVKGLEQFLAAIDAEVSRT